MSPFPTPRTRSRAAGGFTLFEVLIAIAVLVLGLIAVGKTVNMAFRATAASEAHLKALNFARLEIERLRAIPFSSEDLMDGSRSFTNSYTNGMALTSYAARVMIQTRTNDVNLKDIVVQVDWTTPYLRSAPVPAELQTTLSRVLRP